MQDRFSEIRKQVIKDILGENMEEYESFKPNAADGKKKQHRQRVPLWKFLLHLINRDKTSKYIEWISGRRLEFRIKDSKAVAELWGSVKNKTDMTYEKLGRAMRYYYGKRVIEKVLGRRFSYRFILSRKTKNCISQLMNIDGISMDEILNDQCYPEVSASDIAVCNCETSIPDNEKIIRITKDIISSHIPSITSNGPCIKNQNLEEASALTVPIDSLKLNVEEACNGIIPQQIPVQQSGNWIRCQCNCQCYTLKFNVSDNTDNLELGIDNLQPAESISHQFLTHAVLSDTNNNPEFTERRAGKPFLQHQEETWLVQEEKRDILLKQTANNNNRKCDPFMGSDYNYLKHKVDINIELDSSVI